MTLTRKRRKPRLGGTACVGGKRCIATHDYNGRRYCAFHLADVMYAQHVRGLLDGRCELAGVDKVKCNGNLQCAHIMSRRYRATRWLLSPMNAMPLCAAHHYHYTGRPIEWQEICEMQGVNWDMLRKQALYGEPMDPEDVIAELT